VVAVAQIADDREVRIRCCAGAAALSALWPALACRLLLLLCTPRLVAAGTEACSEAAVLG